MKKLLSILSVLFSACVISFAQAQVLVQVPSAVSVDETFRLTFVVDGEKVSDFQWPGTPDFTVQWGPQSGSSRSTSIINGKVTTKSTYSYTYVLSPTKAGTFTIPACSVKIKGKTIESNTATIVVAQGSAPTTSSSQGSTPSGGSALESTFLQLHLDRKVVVLGEPIIATLKLYTRGQVVGFEDVNFPSFNGFWSQTLENPSNIEFTREAVDGQVYDVAVLRKYKIIPQKTGAITIDPAHMVCQMQVRSRGSASSSVFDSFFQNDYSTVRKRVSTSAVTVEVKDLPKPVPASFCGGVGKFQMSVSISKDSLSTHDAASLIVKINGSGNLNLIDAPKIKFPSDFELYELKTLEDANSRVFEYPFIPRHHGDFELGPFEFSYYDISKKAYQTISSDTINLHVAKSQVSEGSGVPTSFVSQKDVKNLGTDIRYISRDASALRPSIVFFVLSGPYCVLVALVVLLAVVAYFLFMKMRKDRKDVVGARKKGATKQARKKLVQAESYLKQGLSVAFYEELHKAMLGFVADKYAMDFAQLDKDKIEARLKQEGIESKLVEEYIALLDACEYARYAPDNQSEKMNNHYNSALEIFSSMGDKHAKGASKLAMIGLVISLSLLGSAEKHKAFALDKTESTKVSNEGQILSSMSLEQSYEVWEQAVQAYSDAQYEQALALWQQIESSAYQSAELYYNMGCAYFKTSNLAHAILYYERALKLDPSYEDAKHNLDYVGQFLQDRIEVVPEFFLVTFMKNLRSVFSSNAWAWFSIVFLALAMLSVLLFLLSHNRRKKLVGFSCAIVSLLLFVLSFSSSIALKNKALDNTRAVVTAAVSVVKSSPDMNSGTDLFVLHEGSRTQIIELVGQWYKIELSDGRQGWIKQSAVEII